MVILDTLVRAVRLTVSRSEFSILNYMNRSEISGKMSIFPRSYPSLTIAGPLVHICLYEAEEKSLRLDVSKCSTDIRYSQEG